MCLDKVLGKETVSEVKALKLDAFTNILAKNPALNKTNNFALQLFLGDLASPADKHT